MSFENDFAASSPGAHVSASDPSTYMDNPYLQPVEGGYYKCTLCSSLLPGEFHVQMHLEGKLHKRNLGNVSSHPNNPYYLEQYARQFFEGETELTFGVVSKEHAPAHWSDDMRCELCDASLLSFDTWMMHFAGKKHIKARRNHPNRLQWQCLHADFPYYYEHTSGMWQSTPPKHGIATKNGNVIVLPPIPNLA